jgi:ABC-type Fe3+/spermidine/putrescine transport system ATPase subunit
MSDRVAIMRDGVIWQLGTPEEIYLIPANSFVAKFVGKINIIKGPDVSGVNESFNAQTDLCSQKIPSIVLRLRFVSIRKAFP